MVLSLLVAMPDMHPRRVGSPATMHRSLPGVALLRVVSRASALCHFARLDEPGARSIVEACFTVEGASHAGTPGEVLGFLRLKVTRCWA